MRPELRIRFIAGLLVFLTAMVTYLLTAAPTVSFWDCGELIAASNILGNPHPPGNPLFTILARAFIVLMPFKDIAFRVNIISVLTSAFMVVMVFLFTVKLIDLVFERKMNSINTAISGVIAAFLVTFADTIWFSAVEAEVYGTAMLVVMSISWLSLYWFEHRGTPKASRALVFITYLGFLGMGIHPFAFITMPVVALFVIIADKDLRYNVAFWLTGILLLAVIYDIGDFVWYALAAAVINGLLRLVARTPEWKAKFNLCIALSVVSIVGFSSYLYVPIRSYTNPTVDEGEPRTADAFKEYLERKQYGSESMLRRALHRRGQLANQLLVHPHMGYGGYMFSQYLPWKVGETRPEDDEPVVRMVFGKRVEFPSLFNLFKGKYSVQYFLFLLFQAPFLLAGYYAYRRNRSLGLYALGLYLATSYGLLFYMNFADGTGMELRDYEYWQSTGFKAENKPDNVHLEVRDRDYFYTPGFIYMGVLFGVAAALVLERLRRSQQGRTGLAHGTGIAMALLAAAIPAWSNWKEHDRSAIYMPWDYAYNLLNSCRPNAVLFTNGDNDTFPLWFMQEVERIRTDVRVVNLSLVNTNWYVNQLKEQDNGLHITFTEQEINALEPQPWKFDKPVAFKVPNSKIVAELAPRGYLRVQDIMVLHIVQNNYPKRPIQFAVTVGDDNMMGLEKWVKMEGMVYTLVEEQANKSIDADLTARMVDSVYRFRKLGEPGVYIDPNTEGLLTNYSATNFRLVMWAQERLEAIGRSLDSLAKLPASDSVKSAIAAKENEKKSKIAFAQKYLALNTRLLPREWRNHYYAAQFYMSIKDYESAETALKTGLAMADDPKPFSINLVQLYLERGETEKAEGILTELKNRFPNDFEIWYSLAEIYQRRGDMKKARDVLNDWLQRNPSHQYAGMVSQSVQDMDARLRRAASALPAPESAATVAPQAAPAPGQGGIPGVAPVAPKQNGGKADTGKRPGGGA